jgi:peptidoglycan biosynthesis protein MviN/MurJ (putative lipid II flippase)
MASLLLLPFFGLAGIALGTFIAFAFEKIVLIAIVRRRYGIPAGDIIHLRTWLGYIVLLSVCFIASVWIFGI